MLHPTLLSRLIAAVFLMLSHLALAQAATDIAPANPTTPPPPLGVSPGAVTVIAPTTADKEALHGLKEVKMVFDIGVGDAKQLLGRLELIEQTRAGLLRQGVTPRFLIAFRGPASRLTQKDASLVKAADQGLIERIHDKLIEMSKETNLELNQCALGNTLQRVKNEDTYPELKLVSNSIVTISAYQNRGYGYLSFE